MTASLILQFLNNGDSDVIVASCAGEGNFVSPKSQLLAAAKREVELCLGVPEECYSETTVGSPAPRAVALQGPLPKPENGRPCDRERLPANKG